MNRTTMRIFIRTFGPQNEYNNKTHYTMRKLLTLISMLLALVSSATAGVIVTDYLTAQKGTQVKGSPKADTHYIISGIDQSSREFYLFDNGGQAKGSSTYPASDESTGTYLWTLKAVGNAWVITNAGTGRNMNLGSSNGSAISMSDTEQTNAIHFDSNGYLTILNSNGQAIDMTANGANPTTWTGTTTPTGSRRLKIYEATNVKMENKRSLSLLPVPKSVSMGEGEFTLEKGFTIGVGEFTLPETQNAVLADVARFITTVNQATGLECTPVSGQADITIAENSDLPKEGYTLDITANGVQIQASTANGVYYALQTTMHLLPPNVILGKEGNAGTTYALPIARIEDEPRFSYRGFMLDVSRHFFTIEQIKKMLDLMAIYKFNVFHWHLTDDQGWRAEIKQYPLLTTKGAERKSSWDTPITRVEENGQVYWTGEGAQTGRKYGPFYYTQEEMRDIVRYAAERHIDVLPEVDMPGHFVAAMHAYPEYSCHPDRAPEVWTNGGISTDVLNVANPEAVQFAKNIITELCAIFPYPYFHIGGDECPTSQWESNALCQQKLQEMGKTSFRALQTEFIREINAHLATLGKKMFCWNESITESGADLDLMKQSGATIMCWNPCQSGAAKAASLGLDAIITEWGSGCYYINRRQSNDYGEPTGAGSGNDNVAATYNYMPVPSNVTAEAAKHYIGVQATFWTEHVSSDEYLEYAALPRLMCVAEAGWSQQEHKNWPSFVRRMTLDTELLDLGGYIYARHWMDGYVPRQAPASPISDGSVVTFTNKSADRGQCLADNGGTLNGQGSVCTEWTLEAAGSNKFYIRSNVSGKYLYAANGDSGTMVELSTSKTAWAFDTSTTPGYVAICYDTTKGNAINNNVSNTTKTRLFAHGTANGASFWAVATQTDDELKDGETGLLTYNFYYRGISVGRKEFRILAGTPYPAFAEHVPNGYMALTEDVPQGSIHLLNETKEITVVRVPQTGRYYRFHNAGTGRYLSTASASAGTFSSDQPEASTIFYYNGNSLLAYDRGQYLDGAALSEIGSEASEVHVLPALSEAMDMYNIITDDTYCLGISAESSVANNTGDKSSASSTSAYDFGYRHVLTLPVSTNEGGWATFSASVPVTVPQGCIAYVTDSYDAATASLTVKAITPGTAIAANTGLLLHGAPSATIELTISESGSTYPGNLLLPSVQAAVVEEGENVYAFVYENERISFKLMGDGERTLPAHSCRFITESATLPQSVSIILPGEETGIGHMEAMPGTSNIIYNIQGQSLKTPQPGINIINGKKTIIR